MTRSEPTVAATRAEARVALVSCAQLPDLHQDDRLLLAPLAAAGVRAQPAVWDDATVDWSGYDLAVLRSPWDYAGRRDEFVAWAARVPRLLNPATVVTWNTDKRYLAELAEAGVPVVPTAWLAPGDPIDPALGIDQALRAAGEIVIKPTISAGSRDTGRYDIAEPPGRAAAVAHLARLHAAGRVAMVQPYLDAVDLAGETALVFFNGRYSHAIRKGPILDGPDLGSDGALYRPEDITAREPSAAELAVAERVLAALPFPAADLLYARVDLVPDPDGAPVLLELEVSEPSLFLETAPGAAERLAAAVVARLS